MSSSPITPVTTQPRRVGDLLELLATVPDPRDPRGVRYPLAAVLAVAVSAVLAGARSFAAIGEWAADLSEEHRTRIGLGPSSGSGGSSPDESTLRKLFARLDPDHLDRVIGAWLWTRSTVIHGRRVIALDGKTVRGARTPTTPAPHLVAALDHTTGTVLGQVQVAAKTNEIPAVRDLLACFDLTGVVVTVDATHTQTDTATAITTAGGTYVFTVKGNTPTLHRQLKALPWKNVPAHSVTITSRGRRATRTIRSVSAPDLGRVRRGRAGRPAPSHRHHQGTQDRRGRVPDHLPLYDRPPRRPTSPSSPPGSKATGPSRTSCTGCATSPSTRTAPRSAPATHPGSWPPSATPPSASCA